MKIFVSELVLTPTATFCQPRATSEKKTLFLVHPSFDFSKLNCCVWQSLHKQFIVLYFSVVEHSTKNRMHVQNIAIVFGPTLLLKPPDESRLEVPGSSQMAVYMVYQNQIIDEMLTEYHRIFG